LKDIPESNIEYITNGKTFTIGDFEITPRAVPHGVKCYAYEIVNKDVNILYATDLQSTDNILMHDIDMMFLEANYCINKLESRKAIILKNMDDVGYMSSLSVRERRTVYGNFKRIMGSEGHLSKQASRQFYIQRRRTTTTLWIHMHTSSSLY
jgi:hypothetical protein